MSFPIPKIQYKNTDDVNGATESTTVILMDSIVGAEVGMNFFGPGVPDGTLIQSIDAINSKFTLSQGIALTLGSNFSWCYELKFRYPAEENENKENTNVDQTISVSRSGVRQYLTRFIEKLRPLKFNFLTREEIDWLETMFDNWFSLGEFVRYFDDQNTNNFVEYQANDSKFSPKFIKGTSELYSLEIDFVRVQ